MLDFRKMNPVFSFAVQALTSKTLQGEKAYVHFVESVVPGSIYRIAGRARRFLVFPRHGDDRAGAAFRRGVGLRRG